MNVSPLQYITVPPTRCVRTQMAHSFVSVTSASPKLLMELVRVGCYIFKNVFLHVCLRCFCGYVFFIFNNDNI